MDRLRLLGAIQHEPIVFVSAADDVPGPLREALRRAEAEGEPLGTPPAGSPPHLAALRLQQAVGARLNLVPFPSAAATHQAVVGGNVFLAALGLGEAIASLREGKLAGLGLADRERSPLAPDVPTLQELGAGVVMGIDRGLAVPASYPASARAIWPRPLRRSRPIRISPMKQSRTASLLAGSAAPIGLKLSRQTEVNWLNFGGRCPGCPRIMANRERIYFTHVSIGFDPATKFLYIVVLI